MTFLIDNALPSPVAYVGDVAFTQDNLALAVEVEFFDVQGGISVVMFRGFRVIVGDYTLSVVWGTGTYSANRHATADTFVEASPTAEVALWGSDGQFIPLTEGDDVYGWATPAEVLDVLIRLQHYADTGKQIRAGVLLALNP